MMRYACLMVLILLASAIRASLGALLEHEARVDVCAFINDSLKVPNYTAPNTFITVGSINACLCVSSVSSFVRSNTVGQAASVLVGQDTVVNIVVGMIHDDPGHHICEFPDHSVASCISDDPCWFTCTDGFTAQASQCACSAPSVVCNGVCGRFASCPSASVGSATKRARGTRYRKRGFLCAPGLMSCPILGAGRRPRRTAAWECTDTMSDLENCGGCAILDDDISAQLLGRDCTTLQGVSDVSCVRGKCVIHRCDARYELSWDGMACIVPTLQSPSGIQVPGYAISSD